jgi:uncharacterized membrane protein YkgB
MIISDKRFEKIDRSITSWMSKYGLLLLRLSLGVIFFWFGILKFFPGLSPAQDLANDTIDVLTLGLIPGPIALNILAAWEVLIGIGLITGIYMRVTLLLLFMQLIGTMSPVLIFPEVVFNRIAYAPTLEGQYIIKNLIIASAGIVLGATVRKRRPRIA